MLGRRSALPVLAEISGPGEEGPWSLRRGDFASLEGLLPRFAQPRTVLVAGEGEAPVVAAIAVATAAAASGRRTILVDCDLTRPRLSAQLGLRAEPGLHEYLRWEAEPAEVLQPVALAGPAAAGAGEPLVCLCGGRPSSKAETLLGLQSFSHVVAKLHAAYELVLLIAPPVESEAAACLAAAQRAAVAVAALPASAAEGREGRGIRAAARRLPIPVLGTVAVNGR
jgi:Mrp family chromosome partitioning ATPase